MSKNLKSSDVTLVETEKVELKSPLVILGFAGPGLVGGIAVTHIIEQFKMKEIAQVRSKYLPPAVVFIDGKLRHPFRIYSDEDGKLCIVVCEIPLFSDGAYPIALALLDWAEEKNVKEMVVLDGASVQGIPSERPTFCAAEPEKIRECEEKDVKRISAGIIRGIAGSILDECLIRKITGVAFLTPAIAYLPDPEGAAALIETVNKVYNLKINTDQLLKESKKIKEKLKEVARSRQQLRQAESKRGLPEQLYA